jgi:hypothetical protein
MTIAVERFHHGDWRRQAEMFPTREAAEAWARDVFAESFDDTRFVEVATTKYTRLLEFWLAVNTALRALNECEGEFAEVDEAFDLGVSPEVAAQTISIGRGA